MQAHLACGPAGEAALSCPPSWLKLDGESRLQVKWEDFVAQGLPVKTKFCPLWGVSSGLGFLIRDMGRPVMGHFARCLAQDMLQFARLFPRRLLKGCILGKEDHMEGPWLSCLPELWNQTHSRGPFPKIPAWSSLSRPRRFFQVNGGEQPRPQRALRAWWSLVIDDLGSLEPTPDPFPRY